MRLRGNPATRKLAVKLRREMSPAERRLWSVLRRDPEGLHFRRQHGLGPYVVDFYCARASLAIEVDGEGHGYGDQPHHDARRDAWLSAKGIITLRVPATALLQDLDAVRRHILATAQAATPPRR